MIIQSIVFIDRFFRTEMFFFTCCNFAITMDCSHKLVLYHLLVNPTNEKKNGSYSREPRAKIARYAIDHGNHATARNFLSTLHGTINESTVLAMKPASKKKCERYIIN